MALILDETFSTGIPGSFATLRAQSGTPSATYNAGAQAVDISTATAAQSMWDLTSVPLQVMGEFEFDLEFRAELNASNYRHAGVWVVSGAGTLSDGIRPHHWGPTKTWATDMWTGVLWGGNTPATGQWGHGDMFPFDSPGDRCLLNCRWDLTPARARQIPTLEVRVNGNLVLAPFHPSIFTSFRPAVFFYQCSVRLHSVKVWDVPQVSIPDTGQRGVAGGVSRLTGNPPTGAPVGRALPRQVGAKDIYFSGDCRVGGTLKFRADTQIPAYGRLQLIDQRTGIVVQETWSDPLTGAYEFINVLGGRLYVVIGYDYNANYRATAADNVVPERMV